MIGLHSGQPLGKVVDHVIAAEFSVGDDVDTSNFLILDGCLHGGVVYFIQLMPADTPGEILGL